MKMTISRALAELKLLDSKINDAIRRSQFAAPMKNSDKTFANGLTRNQFEARASETLQSINDLIARRTFIKTKIVESNAATLVTIGTETMTVAAAIEKKGTLGYEENVLSVLANQHIKAVAEVEKQNINMSANLERMLEATLGREGKQTIKADDLNAIAAPYKEQNSWSLVALKNIQTEIEARNTALMEFKSEVDLVLSESNAITSFEI